MHSMVGPTGDQTTKLKKRNSRIPRMGRVVFSEGGAPVHCAVRNFSEDRATITMNGWIGFPSEFKLFVEPDSVCAECRVIKRKGSTVEVDFTSVKYGMRYKAGASA